MPLFHTLRRKFDEVLTFDFIDVFLTAEVLEGIQNWTVRAKGSKAPVVLHVLFVCVERRCQSLAFRSGICDLRLRNDAVLRGRKFGLLYARLFCSILCMGTNSFAVTLSVIPPLNEVASRATGEA